MEDNHYYTKVYFDGEKYIYTCICGHEVVITDGNLPVRVEVV